ncbi:hypothetical protein C8R43DRAFT_948691 [Mycena crocata]|nr:hypothetical protein C8R43DRAFT_948691 [Mycena crocata]
MSSNQDRQYDIAPSPGPGPGHQRNRIACSNCRGRKVKCPTKDTQTPCERCVKNRLTCEYVALSNDERKIPRASSRPESGPPAPRWVQPLDPESCARRKGMQPPPPPPEREVPTMNAGHGMQPGPSSSQKALNQQQYGYPQSSQMVSVGSSQGMLTGNQFPPAYPQIAVPRIHYGPFPGPAKTSNQRPVAAGVNAPPPNVSIIVFFDSDLQAMLNHGVEKIDIRYLNPRDWNEKRKWVEDPVGTCVELQ